MDIPTLVVSNPPHGEVDVEAAAKVLQIDVFAAGLKASFVAPEVMAAATPEEADDFAATLKRLGFNVSVVQGSVLGDLPWPDPVSTLALDVTCLRATVGGDVVEIRHDAEVVGVYCRPPADSGRESRLDLHQAVVSGHGPTIAEAIQWRSNFDMYFRDGDSLRRVSIVPDLLELDGERLVKDITPRFPQLRLDARLAGVRPRAPFGVGGGRTTGPERRRYSFGTRMLGDVLASIAPELRSIPQYEFGSRLAYALDPLGVPA